MIELNDIDIDEVAGGAGFFSFVTWANYAIEFGTGWIDGVNAATAAAAGN